MTTELAKRLWAARLDGTSITLDATEEPISAAEAYALQAAGVALSGLRQVGWKIGASTTETMALLGVDQPFVGPLFAPHCRRSGAEVALPRAHTPGLESEFLVGLAVDLPSRERPYGRDDVLAAIGFVAPSFELVGCRITGGFPGRGLAAIADGGANIAIIQGEPLADWQTLDLAKVEVRLEVDGKTVASGTAGEMIFGDPIGAVAWLASHPLLADRGLGAGELIMTGTCTGITPLSPGDRAMADFGALGRVEARFT
jgi:2-keto-4-pentenoate hydratase